MKTSKAARNSARLSSQSQLQNPLTTQLDSWGWDINEVRTLCVAEYVSCSPGEHLAFLQDQEESGTGGFLTDGPCDGPSHCQVNVCLHTQQDTAPRTSTQGQGSAWIWEGSPYTKNCTEWLSQEFPCVPSWLPMYPPVHSMRGSQSSAVMKPLLLKDLSTEKSQRLGVAFQGPTSVPSPQSAENQGDGTLAPPHLWFRQDRLTWPASGVVHRKSSSVCSYGEHAGWDFRQCLT